MRRVLGCSLVFFLVFPALVAAAETATHENIADRFDTVSFSGNNGSLEWSGPWVEVGESDGAGAGQVSVGEGVCATGKCLRLSGGTLSEVGIFRPADLERFLDARLHYFLHIDPALLSAGVLHVEVRGGGSDWTTVATYLMLTDTHNASMDISGYIGPDFRLRFRLSGLLGGDTVYIDDVKIAGAVRPPRPRRPPHRPRRRPRPRRRLPRERPDQPTSAGRPPRWSRPQIRPTTNQPLTSPSMPSGKRWCRSGSTRSRVRGWRGGDIGPPLRAGGRSGR